MCCPRCRGDLGVVPSVWCVDGRLKEGWLTCARCACSVADVVQFKFDFHEVGPMPPGQAEPERSDSVLERRVHADSAEVSRTSRWHPTPPFFLYTQGRTGDTCSFTGAFTDALVRLRTQPDGGIVDVFVDGTLAASAELVSPEGSFTVPAVAATGLAATEHELMVASRGASPAGSSGTAALFEEIVLYGPPGLEGFARPAPLNYGNPYSEFIESYLAQLGPDQLALEIGGGDRRRVRPNHLNFEYLKFELADVYGDIHALPFKDDTFEVVHSQAVFEHVADPFGAAGAQTAAGDEAGWAGPHRGGVPPTAARGSVPLLQHDPVGRRGALQGLRDHRVRLVRAAIGHRCVAHGARRASPAPSEAAELERIRDEFRRFDTLISHGTAQAGGQRRTHRRTDAVRSGGGRDPHQRLVETLGLLGHALHGEGGLGHAARPPRPTVSGAARGT